MEPPELDAHARLHAVVSSPGAVTVNPVRGRGLFGQRCSACHTLWGEGGHAGPDLTGSDRRNLDYLLENIIDPSASVPQNYRVTVVELKDGQILSGFVEEDLGSLLRLRAQDRDASSQPGSHREAKGIEGLTHAGRISQRAGRRGGAGPFRLLAGAGEVGATFRSRSYWRGRNACGGEQRNYSFSGLVS